MALAPSEKNYRRKRERFSSERLNLLALGVAILAFVIICGNRQVSALYNNVGCLDYARGSLESRTQDRDAFLIHARHLLEEALRWNPANTRAHHNLGLTQLALGHTQAAQLSFERAIELAPRDVPANHQLGPIYDELGREDEAVEAWRRAKAAPWLVRQGLRCRAAADEACAERYYGLALEVQPANCEAFYQLGTLYADTGRKAEAVEAYENALTCRDLRPDLRLSVQARLYVLNEQWSEVISTYEDMIATNPDKVEAYLQIAAILHREYRDYPGAIAWALDALEVAPGRAGAYLRLAYVYRDLQDYAEAERRYQQAIGASGGSRPTRARAYAGLSRIALAQGQLSKARAAAEEAVSVLGDAVDYHVLLGDICAKMGRDECAIASYRKALELDPGNERARRQLERLEPVKP